MAKYSKEFKEEALKLSDEIGVKKAASQLGIPYYTLPAVIEGQDAADNAYAIASVDSAGGVSIVGYRKLAGDGVWKERE